MLSLYYHFVKCKCWSLGQSPFLAYLTVDGLKDRFVVLFVIVLEVSNDVF